MITACGGHVLMAALGRSSAVQSSTKLPRLPANNAFPYSILGSVKELTFDALAMSKGKQLPYYRL